MRKRWFPFLVWVLIVALPMQGYAAATMLNCGRAHHNSAGHHVHGTGTPHDHDSIAHGSHHADQHAAPATDDPVIHPGQEADLAVKVSCSACAACCIGIALPIAVANQIFVPPTLKPYFVAAGPTIDVVVKGPDRPPRFILV